VPKDVPGLIGLFELTQIDDLVWQGPQPDTLFQRLFGGQVLGQTLVAAQRSVAQDRLIHSLNSYFLRPGSPDEPLTFEVEVVRDGHTFSNRRVVTKQGDTTIFVMQASFHESEPGLEHTAKQPYQGLTPPAEAPSLRAILEERFGTHIETLSEWDALDVRLASEPGVDDHGAHLQAWVRTKSEMPPEPVLHNAVLAYLSDITLLSVTTIPHEVQLMSPNLQSASIDHSMWFHRPVKTDQWLLYEMNSPSAAGARGFCSGRLYQNGVTVASCAQEGLLRLL
jgi:acyl-CoA thioesterase II